MDSAFFPVEAGSLEAGIHPQPLSQKPPTVPTSKLTPTPSKGMPLEAKAITCQTLQKAIDDWQPETLREIARSIETSDAIVSASDKIITNSASALDTKIRTLADQAPDYHYVLSGNLKRRLDLIGTYKKWMGQYVVNSNMCTNRMKAITTKTLLDINKAILGIDTLQSRIDNSKNDCRDLQVSYGDLQELDINNLLETKDEDNARICANVTKKGADNAAKLPSALPDQIDPPVNSILHSVNFVITYGANISPSWTLLQWKGPSPANSSLAAATGIKTNTMIISLGPRSQSIASPDALRLITNQTVRALSN